jgi:hypothetical protein
MICFAKPGLTVLAYRAKEEFSITAICAIRTFDEKPRDKPILSSGSMLHKDYCRKGSVAEKKNLWS